MLLLLRLLLLGRLLAVLAVERRGSPLACALRMVETWVSAGGWAALHCGYLRYGA